MKRGKLRSFILAWNIITIMLIPTGAFAEFITAAAVASYITTALMYAAISFVISGALNVLMSQDPPNTKSPGSLENFDLPTTAQGRAIQVICGSPRVRGYNDIWHGDLKVVAIHEKVKKNMFGNHKNITVGYKYSLGFQYAWCAYAEALLDIRMDEQSLVPVMGGTEGTIADGDYAKLPDSLFSSGYPSYRWENLQVNRNYYDNWGIPDGSWVLFSFPGAEQMFRNSSTSSTVPETGWTAVASKFGTAPTMSLSGTTLTVTGTDQLGEDVATGNDILHIDEPGLFGGKKSFGGVSGYLEINLGEEDQTTSSYLEGIHGTPIPAFRGMVTTVSQQMYIGTTTSLKTMDAIWKRTKKTNRGETIWNPDYAEIVDDGGIANMNIAHIVREIITDPDYSLGFASGVDDTSFEAAAETLHGEGFGLSLVLDVARNGEKLLTEIMGYANGFLRVDASTNQYQIKLMRDDFNIGDLDIVDESIVTEIDAMSRDTSTEIFNQVSVTYTDPVTRKPATLLAQNTALIEATGVVVNKDSSAAPVHSASLANVVATNALRTIGVNPFSASLKGNRQLAKYNLGDPIRLQLPTEGLADVVVRVISTDLGDLVKGIVTLGVTQDVFKSGEAIFGNPNSVITPGIGDWPIPIDIAMAFEVPYYLMATEFMDADSASLLTSGLGRPAVVAISPSSSSTDYATWIKKDSESTDDFVANTEGALFGTTCLTADALANTYSYVTIGYSDVDGPLEDMVITEASWCQIEDEILKIRSINLDDEEITLGRGCLDTVPAAHASGKRIYFCSDAYSAGSQEFADGEDVDIQLLPSTNKGELPILFSDDLEIAMNHRYIRPYPPGYVGSGVYSYYTTISWRHRDRTLMVGDIVESSDPTTYDPETGTTYTTKLYRDGVEVDVDDTLTGTSHTWYPEEMSRDLGLYNLTITGDGDVLGTFSPISIINSFYRFENGSAYLQYSSGDDLWKYFDGTYTYERNYTGTTLTGTYIETSGGVDTISVAYSTTDLLYKDIRIELNTQRDGYDSWQTHVFEFSADDY